MAIYAIIANKVWGILKIDIKICVLIISVIIVITFLN